MASNFLSPTLQRVYNNNRTQMGISLILLVNFGEKLSKTLYVK